MHIFLQAVDHLLKILDRFKALVDETPPIDQPQRFGNKAFRTWHEKVVKETDGLLEELLSDENRVAAVELKEYLTGGFGNPTRIDYGTGHELSFAAFLCCLFKLRILTEEDYEATVFSVFKGYLTATRKLQIVYRMEPAGSQGVWGLDDFQFLPYIWGSSQLLDHPSIFPKSIPDQEIALKFAHEYFFMDCIKFIYEMKTGPFAEHSNILWSISSIPHWAKVNSGLIKMYKAEVLHKFPVIQHFVFGTLLSIEGTTDTLKE
jgi:serine/threonine-protein phosphatase 2A activator